MKDAGRSDYYLCFFGVDFVACVAAAFICIVGVIVVGR